MSSVSWLDRLQKDALKSKRVDYDAYLVWIKAILRLVRRGDDVGDHPGAALLFWDEHWSHQKTETQKEELRRWYRILLKRCYS